MADDTNILINGIYDAFADQIYRYCNYRLYSKDLAEDATSVVFTRLVEQFPEVRHKSPLEIRQWLFGVASNVIASHRRQKKHEQDTFRALSQVPDSGFVSDEPEFHKMDWPILYRAMSQLSDRQQDILILRFHYAMETPEIARIVGMRPVAVRVTLMRTLRKLKELLQEPFEGNPPGSP
jgi:RNA polymerase sigma-70 factor (ECF subfamily)